MAISKRTLEKWRKEALTKIRTPPEHESLLYVYTVAEHMQERILKLTQELLDQQLLKGGKK